MREESKERYRENYRLLGLRIAYYRKLRGLTQEQLAELVGISWSFLSQIEANNGSRLKGISLNTLFLLCEALEISPVKLFDE